MITRTTRRITQAIVAVLAATTLTACDGELAQYLGTDNVGTGGVISDTAVSDAATSDAVQPNTAQPNNSSLDDALGSSLSSTLGSSSRDVIQPDQAQTNTVRVVRVVDGDTVVIATETGQQTVRLIGIDTPETKKPGTPVQPYGPEATRNMEAMIARSGGQVRIEHDPSQGTHDKYNRTLAYIFDTAGHNLGEEQIKAGYAREYTYKTAYKYQSKFKAAERQAKAQRKGLWSGR